MDSKCKERLRRMIIKSILLALVFQVVCTAEITRDATALAFNQNTNLSNKHETNASLSIDVDNNVKNAISQWKLPTSDLTLLSNKKIHATRRTKGKSPAASQKAKNKTKNKIITTNIDPSGLIPTTPPSVVAFTANAAKSAKGTSNKSSKKLTMYLPYSPTVSSAPTTQSKKTHGKGKKMPKSSTTIVISAPPTITIAPSSNSMKKGSKVMSSKSPKSVTTYQPTITTIPTSLSSKGMMKKNKSYKDYSSQPTTSSPSFSPTISNIPTTANKSKKKGKKVKKLKRKGNKGYTIRSSGLISKSTVDVKATTLQATKKPSQSPSKMISRVMATTQPLVVHRQGRRMQQFMSTGGVVTLVPMRRRRRRPHSHSSTMNPLFVNKILQLVITQPMHSSSTNNNINQMTTGSSASTKSLSLSENVFIRNAAVSNNIYVSDTTTIDTLNKNKSQIPVPGVSPSDIPSNIPSPVDDIFPTPISVMTPSTIVDKPTATYFILPIILKPAAFVPAVLPISSSNEKELLHRIPSTTSTEHPMIDKQPMAEPPTHAITSRPIRKPTKLLLKDVSQLLRPRLFPSRVPTTAVEEMKLKPTQSPSPSGSYDISSPSMSFAMTNKPSRVPITKGVLSTITYIPSVTKPFKGMDTPFKATTIPISVAHTPQRVTGTNNVETYLPSLTMTPTPTTTYNTPFPTTAPNVSDIPSTSPLASAIPSQATTANILSISSDSLNTTSAVEWEKHIDNSSNTSTTHSPFNVPNGDNRFIIATPFVITYFIEAGSIPTEINMKDAIDVTTLYAEDILVRQFFTLSNILLSKFEYVASKIDIQRDFPMVTYNVNITIAERSQYVPEKMYVDAIIQASFEIPAMVNQIVTLLQAIPNDNPLSTTYNIGFVQDPQDYNTTVVEQQQNLSQPLIISIVSVTTVFVMLLIVWVYVQCCAGRRKDGSRMPGYDATQYQTLNNSNSRDDFVANRLELMKEFNISPASVRFSWEESLYNQDNDPLLHNSESDRMMPNGDNTSQSRKDTSQRKTLFKNNKKKGRGFGLNSKIQNRKQPGEGNKYNQYQYVTDLSNNNILSNSSDYQNYEFDDSNNDVRHVAVEDEEDIVRTFLLKHRKGSGSATSSNPCKQRIPGYTFVDDDEDDDNTYNTMPSGQSVSSKTYGNSNRTKHTVETSSVSSNSIRSRISNV